MNNNEWNNLVQDSRKDFIGCCPLCRSKLFRIDGGIVKCPKDHYSIFEKTFKQIWSEFAPILYKVGEIDPANDDVSIRLLERLQSENLINRTARDN